eukprot:scaffold41278_cov24-Tisochrysis_lutea.AAC.1
MAGTPPKVLFACTLVYMKVMWRNHAYLVGALRRPPHGTYKFKEPRHKIGKDSRSTAASTSA